MSCADVRSHTSSMWAPSKGRAGPVLGAADAACLAAACASVMRMDSTALTAWVSASSKPGGVRGMVAFQQGCKRTGSLPIV